MACWIILIIFGGLFLLWIFLCAGCMVWGAFPRGHSETATVIILGCKVKGEEPGLHLTKRIQAAERYLKANPKANCIGSGGKGQNERIPEGEAIRRKLIQLGIAPERILSETRSKNTLQNLRYSKALLEEHGWTSQVVLVTDGFHQYRAGRMAARLGIRTVPVNAKHTWHTFPLNFPRECAAITKLWLTKNKIN